MRIAVETLIRSDGMRAPPSKNLLLSHRKPYVKERHVFVTTTSETTQLERVFIRKCLRPPPLFTSRDRRVIPTDRQHAGLFNEGIPGLQRMSHAHPAS